MVPGSGRKLVEETAVLCVGYSASDNVTSARLTIREGYSFFNAKRQLWSARTVRCEVGILAE